VKNTVLYVSSDFLQLKAVADFLLCDITMPMSFLLLFNFRTNSALEQPWRSEALAPKPRAVLSGEVVEADLCVNEAANHQGEQTIAGSQD